MKGIMKLIEKFIVAPTGKMFFELISHFKYRFSDYVVEFIAALIYVFTFHPILSTLEELNPFGVATITTAESPAKTGGQASAEEQRISGMGFTVKQTSHIVQEDLVEVANDRRIDHRVSIARLSWDTITGDRVFSGINYSNEGQIYCKWKSISMFMNEDDSRIEYCYLSLYCNNGNTVKGRGKIIYSDIQNAFIMGSFDDDNGKEVIYAKYYKLSDVEKKVHYKYAPNDPDQVSAFVKKVVRRY